MNSILKKDLDEILNNKCVTWESLRNSKILLTGATGLIGSLIVKTIVYLNEKKKLNIKLILPVRNKQKILDMYNYQTLEFLKLIETDIINFSNIEDNDIDYIIHGAAPTHSLFYVSKPVETIDAVVLGTRNILNISKRQRNIKSVVILSSMEMYGTMNQHNVSEDMLGFIEPYSTRSSYSESKRFIELMSYCYYNEYKVPVKMARLAQTFGPGILENENRVFKQFCDNILNKENIVLKSHGTTIMNYTYTSDTVIAIFKILLDGISGEPYNVVHDDHMTIRECAEWLVDTYLPNNNVEFKIDEKAGFAPDNNMILSNEKLKSIGFTPLHDIKYGYAQLLAFMKEELYEK